MKSKDKIVNGLISLMQENDFENITIKEITNKAQVDRSTYYRNFKSKEYIIKYKLEQIMDEYLDNFNKKDNKTKEEYLFTILTTFYKYKKFFQTIHKHNKTYLLQQVLMEYFKKSLEKENMENKYVIYYHMGGIYNFTICWIENDFKDKPEELTKIALKITSIEPILI